MTCGIVISGLHCLLVWHIVTGCANLLQQACVYFETWSKEEAIPLIRSLMCTLLLKCWHVLSICVLFLFLSFLTFVMFFNVFPSIETIRGRAHCLIYLTIIFKFWLWYYSICYLLWLCGGTNFIFMFTVYWWFTCCFLIPQVYTQVQHWLYFFPQELFKIKNFDKRVLLYPLHTKH